MGLVVADRVKETSTTTGTGALTLAGAMTGFRAFSAVCANQDVVFYAVQAVDANGSPTGDWEVGRGTYNAGTLIRDIILSSSNSNNAVNFGAATKQVWIDVPAATMTGLTPVAGAPIPDFWLDGALLIGANGAQVPQLISASRPLSTTVGATATGTTATVGAALNGKPTLAMPGGQYSGYNLAAGISLAKATVFAVAKPAGTIGSGEYPFVSGQASCLGYRVDSAGQALLQNYTAAIGVGGSALTFGNWYQMNATYDSSSGAYVFRQNRAQISSGTQIRTINVPNTTIGYDAAGNSGGAVNSFTGNFAELIIFASVLSGAQITAIENYLNAKWGV